MSSSSNGAMRGIGAGYDYVCTTDGRLGKPEIKLRDEGARPVFSSGCSHC